MDRESLIKKLQYPSEWEEFGLLNNKIISIQLKEFIEEYGSKTPEGGTEHYRYGAFGYYTGDPETSIEILNNLLTIALVEPDSCMGQSVIIDIVANQNCTVELYELSKEAFNKVSEKHFEISSLETAFRENHPSWKQ
jgi:hypothetical protein